MPVFKLKGSWMGYIQKLSADKWWDTKAFSIFKLESEFFLTVRNHPPSWYPGVKVFKLQGLNLAYLKTVRKLNNGKIFKTVGTESFEPSIM